MEYEIIQTQTNSERHTIYSIFTRKAVEDNLVADTYGIIGADLSNSMTIDDVVTDLSIAKTLINELTEKSVKLCFLHDYVIDFLSKI